MGRLRRDREGRKPEGPGPGATEGGNSDRGTRTDLHGASDCPGTGHLGGRSRRARGGTAPRNRFGGTGWQSHRQRLPVSPPRKRKGLLLGIGNAVAACSRGSAEGDTTPIGRQRSRCWPRRGVTTSSRIGVLHCCFGSTQRQRSRRMCWKPGEPHGRLQGATDLHCARGANRRSREKRQGRNRTRAWHARAEGAPRSREAAKAPGSFGIRATKQQLPASAGTPFGRGRWSTGSGRVQRMSTERRSLRPPMRGVRQDSPLTSFGRTAPRPGRVGDTAALKHASGPRSGVPPSGRAAEGMRGVDDALPGGAQRTTASAAETGHCARGQPQTTTGLGPWKPWPRPSRNNASRTTCRARGRFGGCGTPAHRLLLREHGSLPSRAGGPTCHQRRRGLRTRARGSASPQVFFGTSGGGGAD
jgi:hypothetical protein